MIFLYFFCNVYVVIAHICFKTKFFFSYGLVVYSQSSISCVLFNFSHGAEQSLSSVHKYIYFSPLTQPDARWKLRGINILKHKSIHICCCVWECFGAFNEKDFPAARWWNIYRMWFFVQKIEKWGNMLKGVRECVARLSFFS